MNPRTQSPGAVNSAAPVVRVRDLHKSYGSFEAVAGISFDILPGETFALLGPNGAGKSTTIEILEGYRNRTSGEVSVLGVDPHRGGLDWKARLGIVLQSTGESGAITVTEQLSHFAGFYPNPRRVDEVIEAVGLGGLSFAFAVALGLWITRIAEKGDKHRVLHEELAAAQGELAAMHRDAGSAAERERLAREIHDTIAQSLTSTVMLAQRVRRELDAVGADTTAVEDTVEMIESTAREALTDARSLVASMSPVRSTAPGAAESSLAETVSRLAARFERETGIQVDSQVDSQVDAAALDRELEVVLLRCAQEGLANVRKHSRASVASVSIVRGGADVTLEVRDNGLGLGSYSPETESGFGLAGMRDRVYLVGGELEVSDGADGGTVLWVSVPSGAPAVESASVRPGPTPPVPGDLEDRLAVAVGGETRASARELPASWTESVEAANGTSPPAAAERTTFGAADHRSTP